MGRERKKAIKRKKRYKWNKYKLFNNIRKLKHKYSYQIEIIGTWLGLVAVIGMFYATWWMLYFLGFR